MKLKEIFYLLGMKPKPQNYGHRIDHFELEKEGTIDFANWLHPSCVKKTVEQSNIDALRVFLKEGDTAIDIGAHIGDTTVPVAVAVGKEGCVFGFEPNPYVYEILKANVDLNPEKMRIVPVPYAATEDACKLTFTYSDSGFCNGGEHRGVSKWKHAHAFEVEVEGLDAEKYLREKYPDEIKRLKYIKTDAEGADLSILKCLKGLLAEFSPYIRSEIYKHTTSEQRFEMFQFLMDLGYTIHEFDGVDRFQGKQLTLEDVDLHDHYDIFAVPSSEA